MQDISIQDFFILASKNASSAVAEIDTGYLENMSIDKIKSHVDWSPRVISKVPVSMLTRELVLAAREKDIWSIATDEMIKFLTKDEIKRILKEEPFMFYCVPDELRTEEILIEVVPLHPELISELDNPSEALCIAAVKANPDVLKDIEEQTLAIALAAVNKDSSAISMVDEEFLGPCQKKVQENEEYEYYDLYL